MKKLVAILLSVIMLLSLAACGGGDETPSGNEDNPPSSGQQQEQNTPDPDEGEDEPDNSGEENEGEAWPENDLTSLVPKPENAIVVSSEGVGDFYYGIIMEMSFDDAYAYAEQLVAAGYEGDLETLKSNTMFWGTNTDGVKVNLHYNSETEVILEVDNSEAK